MASEIMTTGIAFNSPEDAKLGLKWMKKLLTNMLKKSDKHEDSMEFTEEAEELLQLIDSISENSIPAFNGDGLEELWGRLLALNEDNYAYKSKEILVWGLWRNSKIQEFQFGYTQESIFKAIVLKNSDQKIHVYKKLPPLIRWELKEVKQKNLVFYTAIATVEEIEQVTSVPALPKSITSVDSGKRILDSSYKDEEWQRRPEPNRITSIKQFVELDENIIANAPMLYVKESEAVTIVENGERKELVIDFNKFLLIAQRQLEFFNGYDGTLYVDHVLEDTEINKRLESMETGDAADDDEVNETEESSVIYKDCRPIWLIDGQHRVRGLSRTLAGSSLKIPIIIFPQSFQVKRAAKIFAEINTLQVSLTPLHKLFMQHRFKIPSPLTNRNFEEWEVDTHIKLNARANNLSYELLAKLASRPGSALYNKVKLLDQNDQDFYVKADQWVNFARTWFLSGPYADIAKWGASSTEIIYNEVNDYFWAFIETVNHTDWKDGRERWPNKKKGRSLLQSATHFKVLINLFSDVYTRVRPIGGPYNKKDFMKILIPFKWVDWIDGELKNKFSGGGEKGRTNLYIWMYDALKAKFSHPENAVMSKNIKSIPGKGIMAPPSSSPIKVSGTWPKPGKPMKLISERPYNARTKPTWSFFDKKGLPYNDVLITSNDDTKGVCEIPHSELFDEISEFKVTVSWANATDPPGTTSKKIS